jgi:hypothetical protein
MNCSDAEVYVSALYDGEPVPPPFALHIESCANCRQLLVDYARIGAELHLLAANEPTAVQPLVIPERPRSRFGFLFQHIPVPRFALIVLAACAVIGAVSTTFLRAQSKELWFAFDCSTADPPKLFTSLGRHGYDGTASLISADGSFTYRVAIDSVSADDVVLRARALPAHTGQREDISLVGVPKLHYKPGTILKLSVEGGATLYLRGDVFDHQPQIAFGQPLVPSGDELAVRYPVLLESGAIVTELPGASAVADANAQAVFLSAHGRTFYFALHTFPGAVPAESNWGQISFHFKQKEYRLVAAAPVTGGPQPRSIWARIDDQSDSATACERACIGTVPVPH